MTDKLKVLLAHNMVFDTSRLGPYSVEIDPTNSCPIACSYCIWADMRQRQRTSLNEDVFRRLLDDLIRLKVAGVVFTGGGEPLHHPFTRTAIALASEGGIKVGLFTSGVQLHHNVASEVLPHLAWIRFNLAASHREMYKRVQGVDAFQRVVDNIRDCVGFRNEYRLNVKLGIGTVLTRTNSDASFTHALTDLASDLGVDFIQFKHDLEEIGTGEYEEWWTSKVVPELRAVQMSAPSGIKIEFSDATYIDIPQAPCFIVKKMAAIKADGSVVLCKLHRDAPSMAVGNINDRSFSDIWFDKKRQDTLQDLEFNGCDSCCGYKEFNKQVMLTRTAPILVENPGALYANDLKQFGDDINFL